MSTLKRYKVIDTYGIDVQISAETPEQAARMYVTGGDYSDTEESIIVSVFRNARLKRDCDRWVFAVDPRSGEILA